MNLWGRDEGRAVQFKLGKARLVAAAAVPPRQLYKGDESASVPFPLPHRQGTGIWVKVEVVSALYDYLECNGRVFRVFAGQSLKEKYHQYSGIISSWSLS